VKNRILFTQATTDLRLDLEAVGLVVLIPLQDKPLALPVDLRQLGERIRNM
jgi:hypothetical protein